MTKEEAKLYSKFERFKWLVRDTQKFIRWSLSKVLRPYLACSFGKDSSAMLHLVVQEKPDIPVYWVFFSETKYLDNYEEVVDWWIRNYKINLIRRFVRLPIDYPFDNREVMPKKGFYDSYFVGLRKEESVPRRKTLTYMGKFAQKKDGLIRIAPLADWTLDDVAAYIVSNELPLLKSYEEYGFEERTTSSITMNLYEIRLMQIEKLKRRDINAYNELMRLCPDLKLHL